MSAAYEFVQHLAALGVPIYTAKPGTGAGEFTDRPSGWQHLSPDGNAARIGAWRPGDALAGLMGGPVVVVDVDPRNGGDTEAVRGALEGIGARIYGDVLTPGGGRHYYVAGHPDVPTCHKLTGFPGVDVQSFGAVAYLPGTARPKYDGAGYVVMLDDLETLADGGDTDSGAALAGWVAERRASSPATFTEAEPWTGTAPDARQAAYLAAVLRNQHAKISAMRPDSGRNVALYEGGLVCGNYVAGAGMDEGEAEATLLDAAHCCGLVADDGERACVASIRSGLRNGKQKPRAVPSDPQETPTGTVEFPAVDPVTGELLVPPSVEQSADLENRAAVLRRFPRLDLAGLLKADRPPREWVIGGLFPSGASVALVAPAGTGKSLLLLAAMLAVARGDDTFAGLPITPRRVLLVDMENTEDDLADRLAALGVTPDNAAELSQLVPIHLPPLAPLDTATGARELAAILDAYEVQAGDVVVLDSLQRVINGAENDSDTMRAYYRHTAVMLKRRGLTVIRTDNTGKDAEKGARGTSGKRDDVDVELILTADAERPGRMYLKPGKVRLPGIERVVVQRDLDDDGHLTYSTAGDPFRAQVADAVAILDALQVPADAGERRAGELVKQAGHMVGRNILRAAVKARKSAPPTPGAVPTVCEPEHRATDQRRRGGAVTENPESEREKRATYQRPTPGAPPTAAPSATAPPPLPSKEVAQARADHVPISLDAIRGTLCSTCNTYPDLGGHAPGCSEAVA